MSAPTTNWIYEKASGTDIDKAFAKKASKLEKQKIKDGYRWYKVDERTRILIPFGPDGNPTEEGYRQIENYKKRCL